CAASQTPAPPPMPMPPRLPAWYHPEALPFFASTTVCAIIPPIGRMMTVAATCDRKTRPVSSAPGCGGKMATSRSVADAATIPITYQVWVDSEKSASGAHRTRDTFDEALTATTADVVATGTPARVT